MVPASPEPARWKGVQENWGPPVLLSSEKVPSDPCAAGRYLYVSQWSPLCMTQVLFKLLHLCWDSEWIYVQALKEGNLNFPWRSSSPGHQPLRVSKPDVMGDHIPRAGLGLGSPMESSTPSLLRAGQGEYSMVGVYPSHFWITALRVSVLTRPHLSPSSPSQWTTNFHIIFYSSQFLFKI